MAALREKLETKEKTSAEEVTNVRDELTMTMKELEELRTIEADLRDELEKKKKDDAVPAQANEELENLKEITRSKEAELRDVQRIRRDLEKRVEEAEKEAQSLKSQL